MSNGRTEPVAIFDLETLLFETLANEPREHILLRETLGPDDDTLVFIAAELRRQGCHYAKRNYRQSTD